MLGELRLLPDETRIFPAHDYLGKGSSTIGIERETNKRLQHRERADFVAMMQSLDMAMPTHLTEALRTNISGGMTVQHLARGQIELRVDDRLPDPDIEILTVCEIGKVSTLAAATLRMLGFRRAIALDGGMKGWREAGNQVEEGFDPALMI